MATEQYEDDIVIDDDIDDSDELDLNVLDDDVDAAYDDDTDEYEDDVDDDADEDDDEVTTEPEAVADEEEEAEEEKEAEEEEEEDDVVDDEDEEDEDEETLEVLLGPDSATTATPTRARKGDSGDAPPGEGEFTCRSCFLVKRRAQLADATAMICLDCE